MHETRVSSLKTDTYSSTLFARAGASARASGQTLPEDRWEGGGVGGVPADKALYTHASKHIRQSYRPKGSISTCAYTA